MVEKEKNQLNVTIEIWISATAQAKLEKLCKFIAKNVQRSANNMRNCEWTDEMNGMEIKWREEERERADLFLLWLHIKLVSIVMIYGM